MQYSYDIDDELIRKSQKKRKRELVTADFTEEQEQDMVEWLMAPEQECLLNKKHPNYIKKGLKDAQWDQKARKMGKTSDQLKKWYANMRSRFGKLKLTPSSSDNTKLTARDRWILHHFEFLRPHLITHVNKRVTTSMKAKVRARAALAAPETAPQFESDSDADHHLPAAVQSDADTFLGSRTRATEDTEAFRSNIAELQRQLLKKLSEVEKSPLQRQKDTFANFMKEVTYTFPFPMWLRFQSEVNNLLQKYQLELHQQHTMQPQQTLHRPNTPAFNPGSSSQQCPSVFWKPHSSQCPAQLNQLTTVWCSQENSWVKQESETEIPIRLQSNPVRPQSAPPTLCSSHPITKPLSTSVPSNLMGDFTDMRDFGSGSDNSFTQMHNINQVDNQEHNILRPVVFSVTPNQESEHSEYGD